MYYWLLSFFIGGVLCVGLLSPGANPEQINEENCQRDAMFFMGKVAEWQHSDPSHPVTSGQSEIPLHFERQGTKHYIWTPEKPGLAGCLMVISKHSRLIYIFRQHHVYDMAGAGAEIEIPYDITDGSILYYYQG